MNLVLLEPSDFQSEHRVILRGRRLKHIIEVHKPQQGESLKVGLVDGLMGRGEIIQLDDQQITLDVSLTQQPPAQLPLTLVMALPRPKMLKRIFQTCATMGVRELILINAYRVEKSYWQSPWLQEERIREHLCLGLEQGVATQIPNVRLVKRFKPFVEDELPGICTNKRSLVAHPYNAAPCPQGEITDTVLAIGPEGGFICYEIDKLSEAGMTAIELGSRILRVETALAVVLAKIF